MQTCIDIFLEDIAQVYNRPFGLLSLVSAILEERIHYLCYHISVIFFLDKYHIFLNPINIVILLLEKTNSLRNIRNNAANLLTVSHPSTQITVEGMFRFL